MAVVADLEIHEPSFALQRHPGVIGPGVAVDIGHGFLHHAEEGHFDVAFEAGKIPLDIHRGGDAGPFGKAIGEPLDGKDQTHFVDQRGVQQVGNVAQFARTFPRNLPGLGHNLRGLGMRFCQHGLEQTHVHFQGRKILRGGIVQLAGNAAALFILEAQKLGRELAQLPFPGDPLADVAEIELDKSPARHVVTRAPQLDEKRGTIGALQAAFVAERRPVTHGGVCPAIVVHDVKAGREDCQLIEGSPEHLRTRQHHHATKTRIDVRNEQAFPLNQQDAIGCCLKKAAETAFRFEHLFLGFNLSRDIGGHPLPALRNPLGGKILSQGAAEPEPRSVGKIHFVGVSRQRLLPGQLPEAGGQIGGRLGRKNFSQRLTGRKGFPQPEPAGEDLIGKRQFFLRIETADYFRLILHHGAVPGLRALQKDRQSLDASGQGPQFIRAFEIQPHRQPTGTFLGIQFVGQVLDAGQNGAVQQSPDHQHKGTAGQTDSGEENLNGPETLLAQRTRLGNADITERAAIQALDQAVSGDLTAVLRFDDNLLGVQQIHDVPAGDFAHPGAFESVEFDRGGEKAL